MKKIVRILYTSVLAASLAFGKCYAAEIDNITGKTRYETAAIIASELDGYSSAVLVNGIALADGLTASGLAGSVDAPILLVSTDSIPDCTMNAINQTNTVYLVGGTGVISENIERKLQQMGKKVIRLGGRTRYETSKLVADEIGRLKGIQEVYYVNGLTGFADAMSIAPVAANRKNPVILTNGKSTDYTYTAKAYTIGGAGVMDGSFDAFAERISGSDRYQTNKNVINKFFDDKDHMYLSKSLELVDALTASALKKPVVLVADSSDKSIIAGAKKITALGGISSTAVNEAKAYLYGDAAVFYGQHQDDETLFAGSAIVDAIESVGADNVYIVLITSGDASNVMNFARYRNVSAEDFSTLRNNEYMAAVKQLGIKEENIIKLNQSEYDIDSSTIEAVMLDFENSHNSVTHIAHSYKYDTHPQHLATGNLLYGLYKEGLIKDCRFFASSDSVMRSGFNDLFLSRADTDSERLRVISACGEYIRDDKDMVREGIGYKSVPYLFNSLINDKDVKSYLHGPGI